MRSFILVDFIPQTIFKIFLKYNTRFFTLEQVLNICKLSSTKLHLLHSGEAIFFMLNNLSLLVRMSWKSLNIISLSYIFIYLKCKLFHVYFQFILILLWIIGWLLGNKTSYILFELRIGNVLKCFSFLMKLIGSEKYSGFTYETLQGSSLISSKGFWKIKMKIILKPIYFEIFWNLI